MPATDLYDFTAAEAKAFMGAISTVAVLRSGTDLMLTIEREGHEPVTGKFGYVDQETPDEGFHFLVQNSRETEWTVIPWDGIRAIRVFYDTF